MPNESLETTYDMANLRKQLGFSQRQMAEGVGLSLQAYQDIEAGKAELRKVHVMACELLSLRAALSARDRNLAVPRIQADALDFAALVRGDPLGERSPN